MSTESAALATRQCADAPLAAIDVVFVDFDADGNGEFALGGVRLNDPMGPGTILMLLSQVTTARASASWKRGLTRRIDFAC